MIARNNVDTVRSRRGEFADRRQLFRMCLDRRSRADRRASDTVHPSAGSLWAHWAPAGDCSNSNRSPLMTRSVLPPTLWIQRVEKTNEFIAPAKILDRVPVPARVATRPHVQIADHDDRPWRRRRLAGKDRTGEQHQQPQIYGSFASEALRISRSLRTKMCLFAYAGCDQCTAPNSRRRAYGCVGSINCVRLIS